MVSQKLIALYEKHEKESNRRYTGAGLIASFLYAVLGIASLVLETTLTMTIIMGMSAIFFFVFSVYAIRHKTDFNN